MLNCRFGGTGRVSKQALYAGESLERSMHLNTLYIRHSGLLFAGLVRHQLLDEFVSTRQVAVFLLYLRQRQLFESFLRLRLGKPWMIELQGFRGRTCMGILEIRYGL